MTDRHQHPWNTGCSTTAYQELTPLHRARRSTANPRLNLLFTTRAARWGGSNYRIIIRTIINVRMARHLNTGHSSPSNKHAPRSRWIADATSWNRAQLAMRLAAMDDRTAPCKTGPQWFRLFSLHGCIHVRHSTRRDCDGLAARPIALTMRSSSISR